MKIKLDLNKDLFFNKISSENFIYADTLGKSGHPADYIKYEYNSLGYRSKEFEMNEDLLIAGCSQTFGMGIESEYIWGNVVSKHFGIKCSNLSVPGSSASAIVNNIFAFFKEFGNPKALICLFPDMNRFQIPVDQKYVSSRQIELKKKYDQDIPLLNYLNINTYNDNNRPVYQKAPFKLEEILTEEVPFFYNMKSIMMLNQYCNATGIKFYWSTWDKYLDEFLMNSFKDNDEYINYISSESYNWFIKSEVKPDPFGIVGNLIEYCNYHKSAIYCLECLKNEGCTNIIDCHKDLENLNPEIFQSGNDRLHMGTHQHRHLAEIIINKMESDEITF